MWIPPEKQRQSWEVIRATFGEYRSLEFAELVELPGFHVYRFKATFSKGGSRPEVRVVLDTQNKVSGLWCKHWSPVMM